MISLEEAVKQLAADPRYASLIREAYLEKDLSAAAERFHRSNEFAEILSFVGGDVAGWRILDLGAGRGIASFAFAQGGPKHVCALDPDPSEELGWGASVKLSAGLPVAAIGGVGESLPFRDGSIDLVYTRQVLHHTTDLEKTLRECSRVLRGGGLLVATREHVVDDEEQLRIFRENHPIHRLAGGENAFPLPRYKAAIERAGLELLHVLGPWDAVINAYPAVHSREELDGFPAALLRSKLGRIGGLLSHLPAIDQLVWRRLNRPLPGRLYSFVAAKSAPKRARSLGM